MSAEIIKSDVDTSKDYKVDKAAKNLKPTKGKELLPGGANKTRPPSTASITQSMATSFSRQDGRRGPEVAMENTFKMTPDRKFPEGDVRSILKEILTERLTAAKYDANQCRQLSKSISDTVKNRVKDWFEHSSLQNHLSGSHWSAGESSDANWKQMSLGCEPWYVRFVRVQKFITICFSNCVRSLFWITYCDLFHSQSLIHTDSFTAVDLEFFANFMYNHRLQPKICAVLIKCATG